jgi:hypothetical protein
MEVTILCSEGSGGSDKIVEFGLEKISKNISGKGFSNF